MASSQVVPPDTVQLVEESYHRCQSEAFFQAFYQRLLAALDETTRAKFARTDFSRQNRLLQHGIGLLFIYAKRANPAILERIAARHGHADLDIAPALYPTFVESLVETVKAFDPECRPELETAWRQAVAPGIEFMIGRHTGGPAATP